MLKENKDKKIALNRGIQGDFLVGGCYLKVYLIKLKYIAVKADRRERGEVNGYKFDSGCRGRKKI